MFKDTVVIIRDGQPYEVHVMPSNACRDKAVKMGLDKELAILEEQIPYELEVDGDWLGGYIVQDLVHSNFFHTDCHYQISDRSIMILIDIS